MGNIIWVASYPKSGNTWLRAFLFNLFRPDASSFSINQLSEVCDNEANRRFYQPYLEDISDSSVDFLVSLRSSFQETLAKKYHGSVLLKNHNYFGTYNGHALQNTSVCSAVIYIVRNPLDIVSSIASHYNLTTEDAIQFMSSEETSIQPSNDSIGAILGSWSTHVSSWTSGNENNSRYCILRYEDLLRSPIQSFRKLSTFLGVNEAKKVGNAIESASFYNLRNQEDEKGFVENPNSEKKFFRQGSSDNWKQNLTSSQIRSVITNHYDLMNKFDYIPDDFTN